MIEKPASGLTRQALAELDSMSMNNIDLNVDNKSMISDNDSEDTFRSWASNWSDCTNATFNKVHKYWRSNSALHKEILAVLAAITEVIKENDGKETETEYFAALVDFIFIGLYIFSKSRYLLLKTVLDDWS